ncbi:MAG: hypothetical protein ACYTF6_12270, partial [Planctomycetota bacterium]
MYRVRLLICLCTCAWFSSLTALLGADGKEAGAAPDKPAAGPAKVKITISKETTYVSGPVNPDGTINYLAYLNNKYSKGVTPENNAAIPLLRAFGPKLLPEEIRAKAYKMLDIDPLGEDGDYFAGFQGDREDLDAAAQGPWSQDDYPNVAAWLKANEKPLALITAASTRPRFYMPAVTPAETDMAWRIFLWPAGEAIEAGEGLTARAMLRAQGGNLNAARADLMAARRLARLVSQGWAIIDRAVGINIESLGADATKSLAVSGKLTAAEAKTFLAQLKNLPELPDIREAMSNERIGELACIVALVRGDVRVVQDILKGLGRRGDNGEVWEPISKAFSEGKADCDETLRTYNRWFDEIAEAIPDNRTHQLGRESEQAYEDFQKLKARLGSYDTGEEWLAELLEKRQESDAERKKRIGREIGNFIAAIMIPELGRAVVWQERAAAKADLA